LRLKYLVFISLEIIKQYLIIRFFKDSEKCAEMLLKSGADPNITDDIGETALHIACRYGNLKLVKVFLIDGASPSFQSNV
jgi:ankyrin repeat protein